MSNRAENPSQAVKFFVRRLTWLTGQISRESPDNYPTGNLRVAEGRACIAAIEALLECYQMSPWLYEKAQQVSNRFDRVRLDRGFTSRKPAK